MSASQRRKGQVGEREVLGIFSAFFGQSFTRLLNQSRDGGADGKVGCLRVEVKRRKRLATLMGWYRQAQEATRPGERSVVTLREDHGPWLVLLSLDDFLTLAGEKVLDKPAPPVLG